MVIAQGQIWWADLAEPTGSEPGYSRPVLVVQGDRFNGNRIATVVCVALTSNQGLAEVPGNVLLTSRQTGLDRNSVANVSQLITIDKEGLRDCVGQISDAQINRVLSGIDELLGR